MNKSQFKNGDKVFAKMKGYPAWPAVITGKNSKKYSVQFYGTNERGFIKPEDIFYYLKHKHQYTKGSKKKEFREALEQIENAVLEDGTDGNEFSTNTSENPMPAKRKRSNSEKSGDLQTAKKPNALCDSEKDLDSNMSEATEGNTDSRLATFEETSKESNLNEPSEESQFRIFHEQDLKNWIAYAEYIADKQSFYESLTPFPRNYTSKDVYPILSPSGTYLAVKLHKDAVPTFSNEFECATYDKETASRIFLLKELVLSGEANPQTDPDKFLPDINLTEDDIKEDFERKDQAKKLKVLNKLQNERTLIHLIDDIKTALNINKAEPKEALDCLNNLLNLDMDRVMLKKHNSVVKVVRSLRKYIGNVDEWNMTSSEEIVFNEAAKEIRCKADVVYKKIKSIFNVDESANFWKGFNDIIKKFEQDCSKLNQNQIFMLLDEPYTRDSILAQLEQTDNLQEAVN